MCEQGFQIHVNSCDDLDRTHQHLKSILQGFLETIQMQPGAEQRFSHEFITGFGEVLANIARHSIGASANDVVECRLVRDGDCLRATLEDTGTPWQGGPYVICRVDALKADMLDEGGRGLDMIGLSVDHAEYAHLQHRGVNQWVIVKCLPTSALT